MTPGQLLNKWTTIFVLAITLLVVGPGSHAATEPVVKQMNVLGSAVVYKGNLANGRQNAVKDALAAAVGQAVLEMLTSETVVRRFQLINDSILNQREKYIHNYRVLTENVTGDTIRTLVQVDVGIDRISRDLGNLGLALADAVYPRIVFMIAEKKVTDADYGFWWGPGQWNDRTVSEGAMASTLQSAGFEMIDPPVLNAPLNLSKDLAEADIIALAQRLGGDVVIVGTGTAAAAPNTMGASIQAFEAMVEAQAYSVQTGQLMGRTRQKSVVSGKDDVMAGREALSGAGALAGDDLARQVMAAWQQEQDRNAAVDVIVEGTSGHIASFVRLRTSMSSLPGVRELKMKEMSTDRAVMAVRYQGDTHSLADALLLKTFNGFGIDIYEVTPEAIYIRLVHR
jgi:hypothetical protein